MPDDEFTKENIEAVQEIARDSIEKFSAEFISKFNEQSENCNSIYEYYSLIISVLVFEKISVSQLHRYLETSGDKKSTDEIIETFDRIASDISSKVITGLIQKVMN